MLETERSATGRFPPGHSGNPAGRPPGARNKGTLALEDALAARSDQLVDALVRSAHEGKGAALRICFQPAETCKSSGFAAAAADDNAEARDPRSLQIPVIHPNPKLGRVRPWTPCRRP